MDALVRRLALLLLLCAPATAHWQDHPELPEWAARGVVRWGHGANINGRIRWTPGGFGVDAANANLLLTCGRTLQQTIGYLTPEIEQRARAGGLRRQPYICSQTVWWKSEYPADPGLDQAVRRGLDGRPIIIYENPDRHCGCYNNPRWLETMKRRVRATIEGQGGKVDSIFFDNPLPYDCYCNHCRDSFRAFTTAHLGEAMELTATTAPRYRLAKAWFQAESLRAFFAQVKDYLHTLDPKVTISPNMGVGSAISNYVNSLGTTDLVFCENGFTLPPDQSTVIDYKLGLASSHGLATGQLLGLSEMLRRSRALALDRNNEMGILESFVYPEEHQLAYAEALACNGTYIPSFALREQKISVGDAPHHVQNREAIARYAGFEQQHAELYARAQPGGEVAVLYSIWTHLGHGHSATAFRAACNALGRAGLPYEVIVEDDLTPAQLAGYRVVVLPQVASLSAADAATLTDFAKTGGTLLAAGQVALTDRLGRPHPAPPLADEHL
ncbi:MAG: beta-galactosidase trimerization domain-containing protein, partial [Armatimonadetes bacterium]|nr:beta-galactosidase trimerization domain-containing protein [Armatimonadota bacterium]